MVYSVDFVQPLHSVAFDLGLYCYHSSYLVLVAQLDGHPTGDQDGVGWIPTGSGNIFS